MTKSFGEYTRLAKGAFGGSSLWAGREHLLYVRGTGILWPVSENYRRIRYTDITALTAAPTPGSAIWLSLSAALVLLLGIPAGNYMLEAVNGESTFGSLAVPLTVLGFFALPALVIFIYNLVRGRTCVYAIETASGILKIRAANRLKVARKVSAAIAEKIPETRDVALRS